jgi:hypothetical protein
MSTAGVFNPSCPTNFRPLRTRRPSRSDRANSTRTNSNQGQLRRGQLRRGHSNHVNFRQPTLTAITDSNSCSTCSHRVMSPTDRLGQLAAPHPPPHAPNHPKPSPAPPLHGPSRLRPTTYIPPSPSPSPPTVQAHQPPKPRNHTNRPGPQPHQPIARQHKPTRPDPTLGHPKTPLLAHPAPTSDHAKPTARAHAQTRGLVFSRMT